MGLPTRSLACPELGGARPGVPTARPPEQRLADNAHYVKLIGSRLSYAAGPDSLRRDSWTGTPRRASSSSPALFCAGLLCVSGRSRVRCAGRAAASRDPLGHADEVAGDND